MDFRLVETGPQHAGLEIIELDGLRYAAKTAQRMFQTAQKRLNILFPYQFFVRMAGKTQGRFEKPRAFELPVKFYNTGILAKVDIKLFPWIYRQALKKTRQLFTKLPHIPLDRFVTAFIRVFLHHVLINPLRGETLTVFIKNPLPKGKYPSAVRER
jgi:hypothetical protein